MPLRRFFSAPLGALLVGQIVCSADGGAVDECVRGVEAQGIAELAQPSGRFLKYWAKRPVE
jgi:hypothetical protein